MIERLRRTWKKAAVIIIISSVLSFLINSRDLPLRDFLSNTLFICSIMFMLSGLIELINNMGMFNSMTFGTRMLFRLVRNRLGPSTGVNNEYLEYVKSRRKYDDIPQLLAVSLTLFLISVSVTYIPIS